MSYIARGSASRWLFVASIERMDESSRPHLDHVKWLHVTYHEIDRITSRRQYIGESSDPRTNFAKRSVKLVEESHAQAHQSQDRARLAPRRRAAIEQFPPRREPGAGAGRGSSAAAHAVALARSLHAGTHERGPFLGEPRRDRGADGRRHRQRGRGIAG